MDQNSENIVLSMTQNRLMYLDLNAIFEFRNYKVHLLFLLFFKKC